MDSQIDQHNSVSLIDDYFDNSSYAIDEIFIETVKRVKFVRQIENITGIRGMSIHYIEDYQTDIEDIVN